MRVFESGSQHEVLLFAYLDRKGKEATVSQRTTNSFKHPSKISEVDEDIGGNRKIAIFRSRLQKLDQFTADQMVVDLTLPRDLEHFRGKIDSRQRSGQRAKSCSEKTCATTQVYNVQIS